MGGFEGKPNPNVFIRWLPFGLLSSHSRLHGSSSYRVPWIYGDAAVKTAQRFTALKNRLMPYLMTIAREASQTGTPMLRHMILEHPEDRGSANVDTQYSLGDKILVAPVFTDEGTVQYYLPTAGWTNFLDGTRKDQLGWHTETHELDSLPVMIPDGTVLPLGANSKRPDYDWNEGVCLYIFNPPPGETTLRVPGQYDDELFHISRRGPEVEILSESEKTWSVCVVTKQDVQVVSGQVTDESFCPEVVSGLRILPQTGPDVGNKRVISYQFIETNK